MSGSDYDMSISDITIPADSTGEHCADISIVSDTLFEGDETFTVTLTVTNPSSGVTLDNNMVEITITDNDSRYYTRLRTVTKHTIQVLC